MDMRKFNGGHSTAGKAGRKKTITDERLRRKTRSFTVNDFEYQMLREYLENIRKRESHN